MGLGPLEEINGLTQMNLNGFLSPFSVLFYFFKLNTYIYI